MTRKINLSKEELKHFYVEQRLSTRDIAELFDCYHSTILWKLKKYNIKRRSPKKKINISKETLKKLYLTNKLSTYQIAKLYKCKAPTIFNKLKQFEIKTRKIKKFKIEKNRLVYYYLTKKLSILEVSKIFECSPTIIFQRLLKYKIPTRDAWKEIYPKKKFSGNKTEMAHMLGFRYGDLAVNRVSKRLIIAKCGTTRNEQIELFKKLFDKYGHVWIGRPDKRGAQQVQATLNRTFDFLIIKKDNIPAWILSSKKYFWAFFAGYCDAEGNIGVYSGRARVRIGSYDKNILLTFSKILNKKFRIKSKFRLETPKGKNGQNQDFWRISVNDRYSILKLFSYIKHLIRHSKRFNDLLKAEKNVIERIGSDKIN